MKNSRYFNMAWRRCLAYIIVFVICMTMTYPSFAAIAEDTLSNAIGTEEAGQDDNFAIDPKGPVAGIDTLTAEQSEDTWEPSLLKEQDTTVYAADNNDDNNDSKKTHTVKFVNSNGGYLIDANGEHQTQIEFINIADGTRWSEIVTTPTLFLEPVETRHFH